MKYRSLFSVFIFILSFQVQASDDAAVTVLKLYKDFSWETVIVQSHLPGLIDQPRDVLMRYFDEKLTDLIIKDRQCVKRTHEICSLDFMPLWDAQDVGATDLTIHSTRDPSEVDVSFSFAASNEKRHLVYKLTQTASGWRISDIRAKEWSLLSILGQPR